MLHSWQLQTPIDTIIFDCDGTLSSVEGIDELAKVNGSSKKVQELTADAMGRLGMNLELYKERLDLVCPTQQAILELGQHYYDNRVTDIEKVIQIFQKFNKNIYIVSAGLLPAVAILGEKLHIPRENIIAVEVEFGKEGNYLDFNRSSPLVTSTGKRIIIAELKAMHPELIFVGDGLNDLAAIDLVNRFIGFGGSYYRQNVADQCQFYITEPSMAPLLPLSLTHEEYLELSPAEQGLYNQGLDAIVNKKVAIE